MRVAVTGATGFIGAALAEALTDHGHDVTALTRHPDDYDGAGRAVHADIGDSDSLRWAAIEAASGAARDRRVAAVKARVGARRAPAASLAW